MAALPTPPAAIRAPAGRQNDVRALDRAAGRAAARGVGFDGLADGALHCGRDRVAVVEDRHGAIGVEGLGLLWFRGHTGFLGGERQYEDAERRPART